MITILNATKKNIICENCSLATTFWTRFKGLMLKKTLLQNNGLYIKKCNSIHMFFMKFSLDIIFVDKHMKVVFLIKNIKPWSISRIVKNAEDVIEIPSGTIKDKEISIGDFISIEENI